MKTVAIVGSHFRHNYLAPFDNPNVDIWTFNAAPIQPWCKRTTASFEIHGPEEYTTPLIEDSDYWKYLQSTENTVYMAETDPRVPASKVYPLQDIICSLLSNIKRGDESLKYFTSSPCYAVALAIYLGYERIEMYGIEMETNSEYIYQKAALALWWGIAGGRGIELYIPPQCNLFSAPLYGYDDDRTVIGREDFEEHSKILEIQVFETASAMESAKKLLDASILEMRSASENAGKNGKKLSLQTQSELGRKFDKLSQEYEISIANYALMQGQLADCRMWQSKIEKMMISRGEAQKVQALNDTKLRANGVTA